MQDILAIERLKRIHELSKTDEISLPIEIFKNRKLGMLESAVLYLVDDLNLSFNKIAKMLNRDNRTIWATYHKAKKKLK
jgi:predicted DNA-binding protein (UPF0251 family)